MVMALCLASSCKTEENPVTKENNGKTVITAVADQIGAGTKAEMAYRYDVLWQEDDQIYVKQGTTTDTFTLVDGEGTTKGTFEGTKSISGAIEAFYPISVGETMSWPSVQTITQAVPMYANQTITGGEGETVNFASLGSMLQINVTASEKDTKLAEIRMSDASEPMSGEFVVTDGKAVMTSTSNDGITLQLDNVLIGKAVKSFYIAVPAGKYEDLGLDFVFSDGRIRKMRSTTMPEINHNTVAKIALFLDIFKMPTKIELNYHDLDLEPDVSFKLLATVLPNDAANKNVIWESSDESVAIVDQTGKVTGVSEGTATITATTADAWLTDSCIVTVDDLPAGALKGKFSVSADRQVYFSQGNLWLGNWIYDRTMDTEYYFEDHQWQHQPLRDSTWLMSHRNHFFWSKFQEITLWDLFPDPENHATTEDVIFTNETETTPRKDFGVVINGKRRVGLWRTLSYAEWHYLLEERPMTYGKPRYTNWWGGVKVEEPIFYGVFIYPDDYNGKQVDKNLFTWKELNDAGVAFLPMAGIRERTKIVQMPGAPYHVGWYWSSTPDSKNVRNACSVYVADMEKPKYEDNTYRGKAFSIRLVRDVRK